MTHLNTAYTVLISLIKAIKNSIVWLFKHWYIVLVVSLLCVIVYLYHSLEKTKDVVALKDSQIVILNEEHERFKKDIENKALKQKEQWVSKQLKAEVKANEANRKLQGVVAVNRNLNNRLSNTLDKNINNTKLNSTTTNIEYTTTISVILKECTTRLTELAEKADGHVNDIVKLQESYPSSEVNSNEVNLNAASDVVVTE